MFISLARGSRSEVFCKRVFLEISQNSQENEYLSQRHVFNKAAGLGLSQVFSCEFCEISKNTSGRPFLYCIKLLTLKLFMKEIRT